MGGALMINLAWAAAGAKPSLRGAVCNRCGAVGILIWWEWARPRKVRFAPERFAPAVTVRCRRVRCKGCGATGSIRPGGVVSGRKDAAWVLSAAFKAKAGGLGFRAAAELVDRAYSTVRNWFQAAARGDAWVAGLSVRAA
jgi:hypothetical protein